jgi:hypothetical protein
MIRIFTSTALSDRKTLESIASVQDGGTSSLFNSVTNPREDLAAVVNGVNFVRLHRIAKLRLQKIVKAFTSSTPFPEKSVRAYRIESCAHNEPLIVQVRCSRSLKAEARRNRSGKSSQDIISRVRSFK